MRIAAAVLPNMKAPALYAESKPIEIETIELAGPGPEEVLIRIRAAGLCHLDLSVINGDRPRALPMALGHEAAGVVEALGERIDDLQMGDHVVMVFMPSCGRLPVNGLLSSTLSLKDINSGFDRLQAGTAVRQIIEFNQ